MMTSLEVASWPIISGSAHTVHTVEFVHLETLRTRAAPVDDIVGESLWSGMTPQGMIGLSWEWAQIAPEVFALSDPMSISSNLMLTASDGGPLSPMATSLVLNRIVAGLPWQPEALRTLRRAPLRRIDAVHARQPAAPPS